MAVDAARASLAAGDHLGAKALYAEAYDRSGRGPWVLEQEAWDLWDAGERGEALKVGLRAAGRYRRHRAWEAASRVYALLADRLSRTPGHDKRLARRLFAKAVHLPVVPALSYRLRGDYERRRGRIREAQKWLERAVAAAPEDPDSLFALGSLLFQEGREPGRAERLLASFLEREPHGRRARKVRRWLRRLRATRRGE